MKNRNASTRNVKIAPIASKSKNPIKEFLSEAVEDWHLSQRTVAIICVLPLFIAFFGAFTALLGKDAYKLFVSEDAVAETLQVIFYIFSFVMSLFVAYRYWRAGDKLIAVLFLGFSGALFFLIGEELSWGQRIFGWQTSDTFAQINKQEETNLHNVYGVGSTFKWVQMLVGAYGTIVPLLVWRWNQLRPFQSRLWSIVPHYTLIGYFAMLFFWRLYRNLFEPPEDFYFVVSEYNEVLELALALGFFFFLIFQMRKLKMLQNKNKNAVVRQSVPGSTSR